MTPASSSETGITQSASRKVFKNFVAIGSGEVIGRVLAFVGTLYAARKVGVGGYGVIAFASGITLYLAKLADFGIETIGANEIARNRDNIPRFASVVLCARLMLALVTATAVSGLVYLLVQDPERTVFSVYLLTLLPIAASTKWVHLGLEGARRISVMRVSGEAVTLGFLVAFLRDSTHLWRIPAAILTGEGFSAAVLLWLLRRHGYALAFRWNLGLALPVFKRAVPVVSLFIAALLTYNLDVIFLRFMRSSEAVGFYAAAYTLIGFLANVCTAYGTTLLPTLARLGRHTPEERSLYHTAMAQIFAVTLPISVGGTFLAQSAIRFGFGEGYGPSGPILKILMWIVLAYSFRVVSWTALVAHGHQALALRAMVYAVVANVTLNFMLIPLYGTVGAAVASVATEFVAGLLTLYYAMTKGLSMTPSFRFWRPIVAGLAMSAALWMLRDIHLVFQLGIGCASYALALFLVGGIKLHGRVPALAV